jgi:hypothetical protein
MSYVTVSEVITKLNRWMFLLGPAYLQGRWDAICLKVAQFNLCAHPTEVIWRSSGNGRFTVQSVYTISQVMMLVVLLDCW